MRLKTLSFSFLIFVSLAAVQPKWGNLRAEGPSPSGTAPTACVVDAESAQAIERQRAEWEKRSQELEAKERELMAREKALEEEITKVSEIRDQIKVQAQSRTEEEEEKLTKLIETLEQMSPKAAAELMVGLDEALAVTAVYRMDTVKLAKIMAKIPAEKASRLSERLTGVARVRDVASASKKQGAAAATDKSRKGGE